MSKIAITDYFSNPSEEEVAILGDLIGTEVGEDTEVLLVWHEHINEEFLKKTPNLRGVQRYGVGYDTLDLNYLKRRNIVVCNNPDYGTEEVADTTVAMIMNIARGVTIYNHEAKSYFNSWQENIIPQIKRNCDTVVGVIGAGRIGGSVLMRCNALRFQTVFYDPYKERGYEKMIGSKRVDSLEELLQCSDILSIHTPLSAETKGIINSEFINTMRRGASIVNTARGGLFDGNEIIFEALKSEKIYCMAIDVLALEPPKNDKLIEAWRKSEDWLSGRLIINPHTSYYSQRAYRELRENAARNAQKIYYGDKPNNILDK